MNKAGVAFVLLAAACLAGELGEAQIKPTEGCILVPWDKAADYTGRMAAVYGKVVVAKDTGRRCYLNFHEDYTQYFSVSINADHYDNFPKTPDRMYRGKRVVVFGYLSGEGTAPQMSVSRQDDILIVPDDQEDLLSFAADRFPDGIPYNDFEDMRSLRADAKEIRIGTYNVLNLFDEHDDPYRTDEVMAVKPRAELERIAQRIRRLDADVLCLQEVENRFYLERFVHALLPEMGYEHVVLFEGNNPRGIDCAVLSRFPVGPVTTHCHLTFTGPDGRTYRFRRDLLKVRIEAPGGFAFDVFCVHLKSKYGGAEASEPVRQAEATEIRQIFDGTLAEDPHVPFVICGDFNDYWDSESLKIIRGQGQTELICPGVKELEEDDRVTYNKEPYRSMIDFIVCSPAMHQRYVKGSYKIIPGTVEDSGSDHNPSVATFRIK